MAAAGARASLRYREAGALDNERVIIRGGAA